MFGKVLSIKPTSDGKGSWLEISEENGKSSCLANINISALKVGSEADFNVIRKVSKAGKPYYTLESFRFDGAQPIGAVNTPVSAKTGLSEAELRFVSNVVGQAILAKTIDAASDIKLWALAARDALRSLGE